jgi:AcrR family transcriptional regulator
MSNLFLCNELIGGEMAKTNRQSRKTKAKIKNALMELMGEQELSKITINELTEKADISRRTFYLHYTDFKALLSEIEKDNMELVQKKVLDKLIADGQLDLLGFYTALNDIILKDNQYYISASKSAYSLYVFNKIEELMIAEIIDKDTNIKKPVSKADMIKVKFFIMGSMKVFWSWLSEGKPMPLVSLVETMEECFEGGYRI